MIKVESKSGVAPTFNPANGQTTDMVTIRFTEQGGRGGLNKSLQTSTDFLSKLVGVNVGLDITRTHSHPVVAAQAHLFEVGAEYPGFINRELHSEPQMMQQKNVDGRLVDGKLTYVTTLIEDTAKEDVDKRKDEDYVARMNPEGVRRAIVGGGNVIGMRTSANLGAAQTTGAALVDQAAANDAAASQQQDQQAEQQINAEGKAETETLQLGKTGS